MKKIISLSFVLGLTPFLVFADVLDTSRGTIGGIMSTIGGILAYLMPILISLAAIYFVWGIISFISAKDEEGKKKGRSKIINGLIGLFVIIAFWGIIGIVMRTFGVDNTTGTGRSVVPCIPTANEPC